MTVISSCSNAKCSYRPGVLSCLNRRLRESAKHALHTLFLTGQKVGIDILPRHFYSNIPDIARLCNEDSWKAPLSMAGVQCPDIADQLKSLDQWCAPCRGALEHAAIHERACRENGQVGYGFIESEVLHCFIASMRPGKIVQVGAGVSTAVILKCAKEQGYSPEIICIDPFPTAFLKCAAARREITLLTERAQDTDLGVLTALGAGDLLFVDSTHAMRPGSEVNRIILEVLPRLRHGAFVHFHDIYFPYDYQSSVLTTLSFGGESTLLHAFLINNERCAIRVSLSMIHHARPEGLRTILPNYRPAKMDRGTVLESPEPLHFPSATYLVVQ